MNEYEYEESDDVLIHEGVLRKSGRYPWGSGENPNQRNKAFLDYVEDLRKKGLSDVEIARGMGIYTEDGKGISTTQLRAAKSIAKSQLKTQAISDATMMKERGMSTTAIGVKMGIPESSVRALLDPAAQKRNAQLQVTADMLKESLKEKSFLDVGVGTEHHMGVSDVKLKNALAQLKEEGYEVYYVKTPQLGTNNFTTVKVLAPPGTKYSEVFNNQDKIGTVAKWSEDGGTTYRGLEPVRSVSSKRLAIKYGPDGGAEADGTIELRRGVDDISLGNAKYAQVRIAVDGTHYIKGMAHYSDDLPDGVDIRFNTNKTDKGNKLAALKELKDDPDSPFGSIVRQKHYIDKNGKEQLSSLNIVNEEGQWDSWSSKLSSQFLSKQSPALAKEQLGVRYDSKQKEYDELLALTNPAVKKKLLETFADDVDSSSVHLKAAGLPRTKSKVILPINSLKDDEVYAPTFRDGERVVLVRHPHGGIFEIPELKVNNKNREAKKIMHQAIDAIGINSKVAGRLSGADFDGDTVLVIPNDQRKVKSADSVPSTSPLHKLKDFDPQSAYPAYDGMKPMSARTKQLKMGDVSNLITDMTIRGASQADLAAAVRHSMVVIDAEKHNLNWQQSAKDNDIAGLKSKYQGSARSGAATLISKASSEKRIPERKPRPMAEGGPVDPKTGKKVYVDTNESYVSKKTGETVHKTTKVPKMALVDDARDLIDGAGTPMEAVYANYANRLKGMANSARKTALMTKPIPQSKSAKETYSKEVKSLNAKLNLALRNAPLERQAQLIANATVRAKMDATPDMLPADLKKVKSQALEAARSRVGTDKAQVVIMPQEWAAIQAGAISNNKLVQILNHTDLEVVKQLATPRQNTVMTDRATARAKSMLANGFTQAQIADALGIPVSTINSALTNG